MTPGSATASLNELGATEMAQLIRARAITSEEVIRHCLARIEARDGIVGAWTAIDPARAIEQARRCDSMPPAGPLHGVPVGVKDIIDTADLPTEMGSPIYKGHQPPGDASCVALLRAAGAVIIGKTVTAEFAHVAPGRTTNPINSGHTPGGSSSGSAAAVADFMVPLAVGTQTGGSTLRPSSYCGIVGYKPTFGRINRTGVKPAAESLDTVGLLARTVEDVELMARILMGQATMPRGKPGVPPRIGLCRTHLWASAQPETVFALEDSADRLKAAGAEVREVVLPEQFTQLNNARVVISNYERARGMAYEWNNHRDLLSVHMQRSIETGLAMPVDEYLAVLRIAGECRAMMAEVFTEIDVLLTPCVNGVAPKGLDSTGDTRFQEMWTVLHTPSLTLPTHSGPGGLPVGIQLVARMNEDERLFEVSHWVWKQLAAQGAPMRKAN